jgi:hypothetical protein
MAKVVDAEQENNGKWYVRITESLQERDNASPSGVPDSQSCNPDQVPDDHQALFR